MANQETAEEWSDAKLAELKATTQRLLRTDTDFGHLTSTLLVSRRLYSAACEALTRFVVEEGLDPEVERFVLLAMGAEAERPYQAQQLLTQVTKHCVPFLKETISFQTSAQATSSKQARKTAGGGPVVFQLTPSTAVTARPGETHVLVGKSDVLHRHMQELLAVNPLGLRTEDGDVLDGSRVARLFHGLAETNGAYTMPIDQWAEAGDTKRRLMLFLSRLAKVLKPQRDVVAISNLFVLTGPSKKDAVTSRAKLLTSAIAAIIRNASETGRIFIVGVYVLQDELEFVSQSFRELVPRGLHLHVGEG